MKVNIISGRLNEKNEIVTEESAEQIRSRIDAHEVVIVRGVFNNDQLLRVRDKVFSFGQTHPEENPERAADTRRFHRIDDNHPKMLVKRIAHFFRYSYADKGEENVFDFMHPINLLRNRVAGLSDNYTFFDDDSGYLSQPALLHYPRGGGYMAAHTDPLDPQRVEVTLALSQRGIDFQTGGVEILDNDKWADVESQVKFGGITMFKPDIPHRVTPIDSDSGKVTWSDQKGRWIMFSPIAHIKNSGTTERQY